MSSRSFSCAELLATVALLVAIGFVQRAFHVPYCHSGQGNPEHVSVPEWIASVGRRCLSALGLRSNTRPLHVRRLSPRRHYWPAQCHTGAAVPGQIQIVSKKRMCKIWGSKKGIQTHGSFKFVRNLFMERNHLFGPDGFEGCNGK